MVSSIPDVFKLACKDLTTAASLSLDAGAILVLDWELLIISVLLVASAALLEQPAATTTNKAALITRVRRLRENLSRLTIVLEKEADNNGLKDIGCFL